MNVIVSVATGPRFCGGMRRLAEGLATTQQDSYRHSTLFWYDRFPPGPTHEQTPFGFKASAIAEAISEGGDSILWLDSSIVPLGSLNPIWDMLERDGYWFSRNYGFTTGEFCSDVAAKILGVTREELFQIPHVVGGAFGLNSRHPIAKNFFSGYSDFAFAGAFAGPYSNEHGECSTDKRVRGHRHDQTVASVVAHRLGMKLTEPPKFFAEQGAPRTEETILTVER